MPYQSARFPAWLHTIFMSFGIGAIYFWLHVPSLRDHSLQLFAVIGLLYFLVKAIGKGKAWHVLPATMSIETVLATMAFLLLVGSTGGTTSWFFPLSYVHLFFVVFSSHISTSIVITLLMMLSYYGLDPRIAQHGLVSLLTLPIMTVFFLFAKLQYQKTIEDELTIKQEQERLQEVESVSFKAENFLRNYLAPKIQQIENLLKYRGNTKVARTQLRLMGLEISELLKKIKEKEESEQESGS